MNQIVFVKTEPEAPFFLFRSENVAIRKEYWAGVGLTELFLLNSTGVKTHRDKFCIDFDEIPLRSRIADLVATEKSDSEIRDLYGLPDTHGWGLANCRKKLRSENKWEAAFSKILYRPFDWRLTYFSPHVIELARMEVSSNFVRGSNLGLIFMRQVASDELYSHFGVTRSPVDNRCFYSNRGTMSFAPLYLLNDFSSVFDKKAETNLNSHVIARIQQGLGLHEISPEEIFYYAYAVFHSLDYRRRYAEFLKIDFPRLPLTASLELFRALAQLGNELVSLHLMESPKLEHPITTIIGNRDLEVKKVGWTSDHDGTVWIDAGKSKKEVCPGSFGFKGVPEDVWNFHIGGYQVCEKWLKDRKGRHLSEDDIAHYQKIVVALNETILLMQEIDAVIALHGGWPAAFQPADNPENA